MARDADKTRIYIFQIFIAVFMRLGSARGRKIIFSQGEDWSLLDAGRREQNHICFSLHGIYTFM